MTACRECGKALCWGNKSGLCRSCSNSDPEILQRRAEGRRKAFLYDPMKRERQRKAVSEANRRPERRARSGELARAIRLWDYGQAALTPESYRKAGWINSERKLAHIPLAYRDEYKGLAKKYGAAEAERMICELADAQARRAHA